MADSPILTGFNADSFRDNIRNTMIMGLPVEDDLKPKFYFRNSYTYPQGTVLDPEGKPIDPRVQATAVPASPPVEVPVAVEFAPDNTNDEGPVGTFWSDRAVLTVLDVDWTSIATAIEVDLSGRRYNIEKVNAMALGPVGVYQLFCFLKGTGGSE